MAWFAANGIFYFKLNDASQDRFTILENIYLIEAKDSKEAWEKAQQWGERETVDDPTLRVDDQPATMLFAGIRKIVTVSHWEEEGKLRHGDEISYSEFEVFSEDDVKRLAKGEQVTIEYLS
jgi:hypothetical protein